MIKVKESEEKAGEKEVIHHYYGIYESLRIDSGH